ncbi:hypothetical protein FRC12_008736 [Ceratobasidium sp. 428]|nr:hypothetical protein FRC12_008736 [Ceratobasidium sp. 428]
MTRSICPIHLLPAEVLIHIFTAAGLSAICPAAIDASHVRPLLDLPSVCKRWRHVVLTTHHVWSHIDVELGLDTKRNRARLRQVTQLWLERAQGGAGSLHFHFLGVSERAQCNLPQMLSILRPHADRISTLAFPRDSDEVAVQSILGLCMPGSVSTLKLDGIWTDAHTDNHLVWAPNFYSNMICLDLARLTPELSPSFGQLIEILRNSPGLRKLRLRHMSLKRDNTSRSELVNLPELRLLDLTGLADTTLVPLLKTLSPGSQSLAVRLGPSRNRRVLKGIQSFFRHTNVEFLHFPCTKTWDPKGPHLISLDPYLSFTPNLRVLVLDLSSDEDLSKLNSLVLANSTPTCPILETLCIIGHCVDAIGVDRLKRFIGVQSSLRRLVLANSDIRIYANTIEEEEDFKEHATMWLAEHVQEVVWDQVAYSDSDELIEHVERIVV